MASLNQRVKVRDLLGTVRFIGETQFAPGNWIGVQLDLKQGKNDGSVAGVRYFSCEMGYGVFARKSLVVSAEENTTDLQLNVDSGVDTLRATILDAQKQILALEARIEMKSIDVDHYKNLSDDLNRQLSTLKAQNEELLLELQLLKEEAEVNRQIEQEVIEQLESYGVDESMGVDEIKLLLEHNKKLLVALLHLQDLFDETKAANDSIKRDLDHSRIQQSDFEDTKVKLKRAEQIIVDLKEQLESNTGLDVLVDQLTIQNEELKATVDALTLSVQEMSEITELDRSLEESQKEIERQLREEISKLMKVIEDDQRQIQLLKVQQSSAQDAVTQLQAGMLPKYSRQIEDLTVQVKTERITNKQLKLGNQVCLDELRVISEHMAKTTALLHHGEELLLILDMELLNSKMVFLKEHYPKSNEVIVEASIIITRGFRKLFETNFTRLVSSKWRDRIQKLRIEFDEYVSNLIAEMPVTIAVHEYLEDMLKEIQTHSSDALFLEIFLGLGRLVLLKEQALNLPKEGTEGQVRLHNRSYIWTAFKDMGFLFRDRDNSLIESIDWEWSTYEEQPVNDIYNVSKVGAQNYNDAKDDSRFDVSVSLKQSESIEELKDTIEILKNSLNLAKTHHQKVVDELKRSIADLKNVIQQGKQQKDLLERENMALEYQLGQLIEAQRESQNKAQRGLGSIIQEKEHIGRMELLSEIQLLRRVVQKSASTQKFDWLEPLEQISHVELPWAELIPAGRVLRSSVQHAPYVKINATESWRPRKSVPLYVVACLRQEREVYRLYLR